jgi:polygalacturonase
MKPKIVLLLTSLGFAAWIHAANPTLPTINTNNIFNVVTGYSASTNSTDNSSAIQSAITAAAAATGGGTVEIPGPGVYLTGPLTMKSKVNLQIDAGAILRMLPYGTWSGTTPLLSYSSLSDVEISGSGAIDGQGAPWWASNPGSGLYMIYLDSCQRVLIENLTVSNAPAQQIVFKGGNTANVTIQGVTISAPDSSSPTSPSHNTDGIDLVGNNSLVQNCVISTGDDNIAMGSSGAVTYNTLITNCAFGYGHGVSIGSYTTDGVTNLTVINCTFNKTQNGIRMKSDSGRGGTAQYLYYYNLSMTNIVYAPILIYSYYNSYGNPTTAGITPAVAAAMSTASTSGEPVWCNIVISNLTATAGQPGMIWAKRELPATNIFLSKLNITAAGSFDLYNITNVQLVDSQINITDGSPTFALCNAQATFSNSVSGASAITLTGVAGTNSLAFYDAPASCSDASLFGADPITLAGSLLSDTTSLTLPASTPVNFALGTNAATVAVTGSLSLNSTLNITNAGGFTATNYTLFTYTGSLSGQPVLGATPTSFAGYTYALTNPAGKVMLVVSLSTNTSSTAVALQVVLPGQTLVTNTGIVSVTGTPAAQAVGVPFSVIINAVNSNGDIVTTATPTVNFTSSDAAASLPSNSSTTLVKGTAAVSVILNTAGSQTVTASDQADVLTACTSPDVTVVQASQVLTTLTTSSSSPWTVPAGVTSIEIQMWGGGGGGGGVSVSTSGSYGAGGGGGGGAYTATILTNLTPGSTIAFSVGGGGVAGPSTGTANGGAGTNTTFTGATTAKGGSGGGGTSTAGVAGAGGAGGTGGAYHGGNGAAGTSTTSGGGGGSAGTNAPGNSASGPTGGTAVSGGGAGATGITGSTHANGTNGFAPGGGGSGGFENHGTTLRTGGAGGAGQIVILDMPAATVPQPDIAGVGSSGANLLITGTNGTAGTYIVLMSTNLASTNWVPVATNTLTGNGSFSITATNAVNTNATQQFFILQAP